MNPFYRVKEEYLGPSSSSQRPSSMMAPPQPMECLHDTGPPPFLTKTYDMVDDPNCNHIVSWSRGGSSFVVWDPHAFSTALLPRYFKHNNLSSFVRQLNTYGFRKIDPDGWEFANEGFLRGQKHLLRNIKRRKAPSQPNFPPPQALGPCVELGRFGLDGGEIDRLVRDKQVLMMELVKLKQQQLNTRAYLQVMEQRLQGTEKKQQQMMSFLARAMQNPAFLQQLVQQKEKSKQLEEAMTKKRRRPIVQGRTSSSSSCSRASHGESSRSNGLETNPIKAEPLDELEALALEMQGYGRITRSSRDQEDEEEAPENGVDDRELDDGFWEELLNEKFEGDLDIPAGSDGGENLCSKSTCYHHHFLDDVHSHHIRSDRRRILPSSATVSAESDIVSDVSNPNFLVKIKFQQILYINFPLFHFLYFGLGRSSAIMEVSMTLS
ncbi:hypothetical protein Ddye_015910 [Dipteronia dyeriana]|uniref:HSF-type DNA-binding domain-containing protein n=1 Tax=Dipteronia dyeriana TaxID=168575 RepID=A0AAD9WYZ1_9ROSI|nr:hypothetical protein Ddye_015910 [Dipteronia dyeriana]